MESSLYIHIPFCSQKCDYCDFFSKPTNGIIPEAYLAALKNELDFHKETYGIDFWKTIYIGGGTPSLLSALQIEKLLGHLSKSISPERTREFTIEMNPESMTKDKLEAAHNGGITRLSLGIQSLTPKSLCAINRHCSAQTSLDALELVKKNWKGRLNLDAIAGLPQQTDQEFIDSLSKITDHYPDHISLYSLTVEEGSPLHKKIQNGLVNIDDEQSDRQWLAGRDLLESKGFHQYEVSNFARPGCESIHNMTYWKQENYCGAGAGASGTVYENENLRWNNCQDIGKYINFWTNPQAEGIPRETELLDEETREFEFLMLGLRTLKGINSEEYKRRFSTTTPWFGNLQERIGTGNGIWKEYTDRGMTLETRLKDGSTNYSLNKKGILFLNNFLVSIM